MGAQLVYLGAQALNFSLLSFYLLIAAGA